MAIILGGYYMDAEKFKKSVCSNDFSSIIDEKGKAKILKESYRTLSKENNKEGTLNLLIASEELNELSQQVIKYIRGKDNHYELLEELADAYLSLDYIRNLCGFSDIEINKAINVKLARQAKRNKEEAF